MLLITLLKSICKTKNFKKEKMNKNKRQKNLLKKIIKIIDYLLKFI